MQVFSSFSDPACAALLRNGAIGVIPTDTVYGLVCRAADSLAVERLFLIKSRENKPGTIIAANIDQLKNLGADASYLQKAAKYWPGPVSVKFAHPDDHLSRGTETIAVRIPDNTALVALLEAVGPLMTTSANHPGEPGAETVDEARAYFGDAIDFYVEGGDLLGRPTSTIVHLIDDTVMVVREGAVKIDEKGRNTYDKK